MWAHEIVALPSPFDGMLAPETAAKSRWRVNPLFKLKLILPLAILVLWEAVARTGLVPAYNFPPPSTVLSTLIELARSGAMFKHLWISAVRVLLGFLIGAGFGTV